jgi:glucokinase
MLSPVVLALDFGGSKIAAAVAEASTGARLGGSTVGTVAADGAAANLGLGLSAARRLLADVAPGRPLAAVGAATFGIPADDGVRLAPAIPGWEELRLGRELRRAFPGAEIRLANDVKAAAQAELEWGALAGCDPAIYLNLGTGLAVAIIANGAVLTGRHGASGEIGYNLRGLSDVGRPLADRVPLEDAVSGGALARAAADLQLPEPGLAGLFAAAGQPAGRAEHPAPGSSAGADEPASRLLSRFVDELAYHLVNLAIAVDPVRVAVGGGLVRDWRQLQGGLRAALDAAVPYPPELVLGAFPFEAPLLGALALATAAGREQAGHPSTEEATA